MTFEQENATLREMLNDCALLINTLKKERDDALARVAELIDVIAYDSRNAILPPPPVTDKSEST